MKLHDRLAELRKRHGYTQQKVADYLGISRGAYANYEIGKREPDAETLEKLAKLYDVTIDYLLTGKTDKNDLSDLPPEEREFLEWVKNNLEGTFFYDFSRAPEEQKKDMMKSLRIIWELEKHRKPGQKQGE